MSIQKKINDIINLLKKEFPGIKPNVSAADPLDVLIATMLSQNTTDITSYRAFKNLKQIGSWEKVMNSPLSTIKEAVRVCGLTNTKSRNIKLLLRQIKKLHGKLNLEYLRKLSNDEVYRELLKYSGVGIKTISCVLAFSLGRDVFPVDTHVQRITNRLGLAKSNTPDKTFLQVKDEIPPGKKFLFHTLLIRFGRKICRAKNPLCGKCRIYDYCEYSEKEFFAENNKSLPKENNFIILEHV